MKKQFVSFLWVSFCLLAFLTTADLYAQANPSKVTAKKASPATQGVEKAKTPDVGPRAPEDLAYTGFWFVQCGNEFTMKGKGGISKSMVKLSASKEIISVDLAGFKRAVKYKANVCTASGNSFREYFILQLTKDAEIFDDMGGAQRSVPACWTRSAVKKYLSVCSPAAGPDAIPEKCLNISICSCSNNSKSFPCNEKSCDPLYLLCREAK